MAQQEATADAKLFEDYFRDVGMPVELKWVENAFDHDGQKAPPLEREDPATEPNIKMGGLQLGRELS